MRWVVDADDQLINMAHVVRLRAKEMPDGTWSVMGDIIGQGPVCFSRGLDSKAAALAIAAGIAATDQVPQ